MTAIPVSGGTAIVVYEVVASAPYAGINGCAVLDYFLDHRSTVADRLAGGRQCDRIFRAVGSDSHHQRAVSRTAIPITREHSHETQYLPQPYSSPVPWQPPRVRSVFRW